jgi:hypothetical protein
VSLPDQRISRRIPLRYAITFCILGLSWIVMAIGYRGPAWLLVWPGVSFLLAGIAYWGAGPAMFGKRADGRISAFSLILLFPYIALSWCIWAAIRGLSSEPASQEIAPGLWVGRRPIAAELPKNLGVIVDLTCELWEPAGVRGACTYLCVPTLDGSAPSEIELHNLVERITRFDGVALIHCAQGHGRSAAVVAAVLVARGEVAEVDEAVQRIRQTRPGVRISESQQIAAMRASGRMYSWTKRSRG